MPKKSAPASTPSPGPAADITWLQLVPPGQGGVRDFAGVLQQRWSEMGLGSRLVACDEAASARVPLTRLLQPAPAAAPHGSRAAVLLHFSGYGYQARGVPVWLVRQIEAARREFGQRLRLVSYFHETHASGPPWRSAFWLSGLQARVAGRLARLSDAVCTNAGPHGRWLTGALDGGPQSLRVCPVFSTVGEPGTAEAPHRDSARAPVAVVFGAASTRLRALLACGAHVDELRRHGVERLVEVGPGMASVAHAGLPLEFLGRLEAPALQQLLLRSRFGLIDYPSALLGKSSVFAALAAHGMVVFNTRPFDGDADGLRQGHHFVSLGLQDDRRAEPAAPLAMAEAVRQWYRPHSSLAQATELAELLGAQLPDTVGTAALTPTDRPTAHTEVFHG